MGAFPALALVRDSNPRLTYSATVDAVLARLRQDLERVADLGAEGRSFEELIGEVRSATNRTGLEALRAATEMLDTRTAAVERDGVRLRFRGTRAVREVSRPRIGSPWSSRGRHRGAARPVRKQSRRHSLGSSVLPAAQQRIGAGEFGREAFAVGNPVARAAARSVSGPLFPKRP